MTPQLAPEYRVQAVHTVLLPRTGIALAPDGPEDDRAYCVLAAGRKSSLWWLGIGFTLVASLCGPVRGNMRPRTYPYASRTSRSSRLRLDLPHYFSPDTDATGSVAQVLRSMVALAMALLLLPLGQGELFAQQAPPPGQGASQNDRYNEQYAPDQQSRYGQQPYSQHPYPASGQVYPQQGGGQVQPINADQLDQLVAPIALYPDTLVAQVLTASTYPAQVADADQWRRLQGYAPLDQIAAGADAQTWDPSVKALTAFPQVLAQMHRNLQWTTDLGNVYYNQPQDVLEAVQVMRQRAQAAGNLQSTPQVAVRYVQGNIELAPVNPQVVYVPAYNPWAVYGQPVSPYPGFSLLGVLGSIVGSAPLRYGLGIAMTAFSSTPWGWLAWGLSWLTQAVLFNHSNYYSNSNTVADWGFPYGGLRAASAMGRLPHSVNRTADSYGWPGSGSNGTRAQTYVHRPPNSNGQPAGGYSVTSGQGSVPRPPGSYSRPGGGYNETRAQTYVHRPPNSYGRPGGGYSVTPGQRSVPRPPDSYAGNWPGEGSSRGYQTPGVGYARSPLEAHNRVQPPVSSPRLPTYRAPAAGVQRGDFSGRSTQASVAKGFAGSSGKPAHASGFHLFGGGHASENIHGGGHAPKSFSGQKKFSSGHSGGGHSGGHSNDKHHH